MSEGGSNGSDTNLPVTGNQFHISIGGYPNQLPSTGVTTTTTLPRDLWKFQTTSVEGVADGSHGGHDPEANVKPTSNLVRSFGKWAKGKQSVCVRVLLTKHPEIFKGRPEGPKKAANKLCAWMKDQFLGTTKWRGKATKESWAAEAGSPGASDSFDWSKFEPSNIPDWLTDDLATTLAKVIDEAAEADMAVTDEDRAAEIVEAAISQEKIRSKVQDAIRQYIMDTYSRKYAYAYIVATYDDYVIFSSSDLTRQKNGSGGIEYGGSLSGEDCLYWQDYTVDANDDVALAGPPVEVETVYVPAKNDDAGESSTEIVEYRKVKGATVSSTQKLDAGTNMDQLATKLAEAMFKLQNGDGDGDGEESGDSTGESTLTADARKKLSDSDFALPGRKYPIHDKAHAANALARVAEHGTPEEKKKVRAAVKKRYPDMSVSESDTPSVSWENHKGISLMVKDGMVVGGPKKYKGKKWDAVKEADTSVDPTVVESLEYVSIEGSAGKISVQMDRTTGLVVAGPAKYRGTHLPIPPKVVIEGNTVVRDDPSDGIAISEGKSSVIASDNIIFDEGSEVAESDIEEQFDFGDSLVEISESRSNADRLKTPSGRKVDAIIRIIKPGPGNSETRFYYPDTAIRKSLKMAYEGKKMYQDHETPEQEKARNGRPRSVQEWVATVKEVWTNESGHGLGGVNFVDDTFYSKAKKGWDDIGVSIRGRVKARAGRVNGEQYNVVESFVSGRSVDFVTEAGAGGGIESI